MTTGIAALRKSGLQGFPETVSDDLRVAISDSISLQSTTCIKLAFAHGNPRYSVSYSTERKRTGDTRTPDCPSRRSLEAPPPVIDRNLKRTIGFCRGVMGKLEGDLDQYTSVTLTLHFKAGQLWKARREAQSLFETAAD